MPGTIQRFSSRRQRLGHVYLQEKLRNAQKYRRIAGYFRSSIFELVHEELANIDQVRIICNSDLDPRDIYASRQAREMVLKEKWNEFPTASESLLFRKRYQLLYETLIRGNLEIRVVGRNHAPFIHGKAGVIELRDGSATSFIGSLNETREGWNENYEILWEDTSPEAVAWVNEEFDYLWKLGIPLPDAIVEEVERCARRKEYPVIAECPPEKLPAASLVEAPIYRRGEALMSWQQAFVGMFLEHRELYGQVRFLLADEVGVGKTLSLATSALMGCLLNDGPSLILCPATLTQQWQIELLDKLGIPSAVWTSKKTWMDHSGHHIKTRGPEDISHCPYQIGIVSTGLIFHMTAEREYLLARNYGTLVLDEAHRARRSGLLGPKAGTPNNLLSFMLEAAKRAKHVLLGTATPIQTHVEELWDLLEILNRGADHVLGRIGSAWRNPQIALELITGQKQVEDEMEIWSLLRNPLPPRHEEALYDHIRTDLELEDAIHFTDRPVTRLDSFTREEMVDKVASLQQGLPFFQFSNPILRHTILRKRSTLETRGLLDRIAVDIHPNRENQQPFFEGLVLLSGSS